MNSVANYIGGRFVPAACGRTVPVESPWDGAALATIPRSDATDVEAAVSAARAAMNGPWGAMSTAERADLLDAAASAIDADKDRWAWLEARDAGKTITSARSLDIPRAIANLRFFAGLARQSSTPSFETATAWHQTVRRPLGVVGLITPWNLPLYLLTWKLAPALAMGNAVVAKPSEFTPLSADALAHLFQGLGLPPGAFNVVHGLGAEAGAPLTAHRDVDGISFTGGTATGAEVGATTSRRFAKLSLELGGKNPTVIFEDAPLDAAVAGAVRAGFTNTGQICLCGSRLFVHASIADAFIPKFLDAVRALRSGDPSDPTTQVGALISAAHLDKVRGYVALAQQEGGRVLVGGDRPPGVPDGGHYLAPTVIDGLSATCRTATEEIFGPVVTVHRFRTEDELHAAVDGVPYGLAANLWTADLARAHRVAARIRAGVVWVNTWLERDLRTPFGGLGASGVGREGGTWSLDFFSELRSVTVAK